MQDLAGILTPRRRLSSFVQVFSALPAIFKNFGMTLLLWTYPRSLRQ